MKNLATTTTSNTERAKRRDSHPIVTPHALTHRRKSTLHNDTGSTLSQLRPLRHVIDHSLKHHNKTPPSRTSRHGKNRYTHSYIRIAVRDSGSGGRSARTPAENWPP